ncbi:phosphatase PAP2 family protein [bacterium]|nr:phosphatase PAP2 family protein [bacterium]
MEARTYRWGEAWFAGYWLLSSLLLLFGPHYTKASVQLGLLQLTAAAALMMFSSWCERHPNPGKWLFWVAWPPCFFWTYNNIDMVHQVLGWPTQDALVQSWEHGLWGSIDPALHWSQAWPWLWFSEFIHICYITYYAMMPVLIIRLLRRDREDLGRLALAAGVCSLVCCYTINIFFPVRGPRPLYPPLAESLHGPVWTFCHSMLKKAAAGAAAFPSGHTSLSVTTAILGWRWDRKLFPFYGIWAAGVVSATVYGRFHYSVDVLAGVLLALWAAGLVLFREPEHQA